MSVQKSPESASSLHIRHSLVRITSKYEGQADVPGSGIFISEIKYLQESTATVRKVLIDPV